MQQQKFTQRTVQLYQSNSPVSPLPEQPTRNDSTWNHVAELRADHELHPAEEKWKKKVRKHRKIHPSCASKIYILVQIFMNSWMCVHLLLPGWVSGSRTSMDEAASTKKPPHLGDACVPRCILVSLCTSNRYSFYFLPQLPSIPTQYMQIYSTT